MAGKRNDGAGSMRRAVILLGLVATVACGCARDGDPDLMTFRNTDDGPDEFSVLPTKPLETPPDLAALPPPTPGGANLVDPTPEADAIAALGGRPSVLARGSADGAVVLYAARYGVDPAIRSQLAASDLAFRESNRGRLLERIFDVNVYYETYEDQSLDQSLELERFRRAGIRTPAAPPVPVE